VQGIQHTLVSILLKKLLKAAKETGIHEIAIAGGVSANSGLRKQLTEIGQKYEWNVYIPKLEYCTDNAAMIAMAAYYKAQAGQFSSQDVSPLPRMNF
jgi:N6-L-threonylcarbamoyladenine synthase